MIYAGFQPGSNVVENCLVGPLPGDFVPGLTYHAVEDWAHGLPQVAGCAIP
ncbi:hypothetical protein [Elstera litoralis]|uniref:hypothetical protein n=1 Tax=Elstera litoralis TaxID=552518 RepID=UPI0012ED5497|nr:hypothetical protein [Elstera litoralis]